MLFAQVALWMAFAYLACGLAVGAPFVVLGAGRIDESARGASWGFRLAILPGAAALWPWVLMKWRKAPREGGPR
jgi:hypothetical protein